MNKAKYAGIGEIFRKENKHNAHVQPHREAVSNEQGEWCLIALLCVYDEF